MASFSLTNAIITTLIGLVAGFIGSLFNQYRQQTHERTVMLKTLNHEVARLSVIFGQFQCEWKKIVIDNADDFKRGIGEVKWPLKDKDTEVYRAFLPKIGLLPYKAATETVAVYHEIRETSENIQQMLNNDKGLDPHLHRMNIVDKAKAAQFQLEWCRDTSAKLSDILARSYSIFTVARYAGWWRETAHQMKLKVNRNKQDHQP